ncbi:BQ5605_C037g11569 [Microbotryum silenes-dioicae]|uniref:BQ5605_C037g11569 protein n=1 Tax=Microbotryum silenes-dioicae TaxID=796604 RepID=A0A2X0PG38_9BASI|nr:BQ5605_C037g11569 [Microbotryum silenes-dioicae]
MSDFGRVFDIINLMNYDVGGPWEATSGPNCRLRTCKSVTSVVEVFDTFKKAGIPVSKMMLGIPAYGYSLLSFGLAGTATKRAKGGYKATTASSWVKVKPLRAKSAAQIKTRRAPNADSNGR